jgi:hypothetical protein
MKPEEILAAGTGVVTGTVGSQATVSLSILLLSKS